MAKLVSPQQVELFEKLTREKKFPPEFNRDAALQQFRGLDSRSASAWIERALALEDLDETPIVQPNF